MMNRLLDAVSSVILVGSDGRDLWVRHAGTGRETSAALVMEDRPSSSPISDRHPPEIQDVLATRFSERGRLAIRRCVVRGRIPDEESVRALTDHVRRAMFDLCGKRTYVKPRVITAAPFLDSFPAKHQWIDVLVDAQARQVFICDFLMCAALGRTIDLVSSSGHGIVYIGEDHSCYRLIAKASELVAGSCDVGWRDGKAAAEHPEHISCDQACAFLVHRLQRDFAARLRDVHWRALAENGFTVFVSGYEGEPMARKVVERLGYPASVDIELSRRVLAGLQDYCDNLHQWLSPT